MALHQKRGEDWDDVFLAFADRRRRRLFLGLWQRGPDVGAIPVRDISGLDSEHDRLKLRHVHLPILDEMGYVRWNRDRGTVERGSRFEEIVPLVEWYRERLALDGTV